jgi:hypothetical protein
MEAAEQLKTNSRRLKVLFDTVNLDDFAFSSQNISIKSSTPKKVSKTSETVGEKEISSSWIENEEVVPELHFRGESPSHDKAAFLFASSRETGVVATGNGFSYSNLPDPVFSTKAPSLLSSGANQAVDGPWPPPYNHISNTGGTGQLLSGDRTVFFNASLAQKITGLNPVGAIKFSPAQSDLPVYAASLINREEDLFLSLNNVPGRYEVGFFVENGQRARQIVEFTTNQTAHITYDLGFGTLSKNVFAFAFEPVDAIIYPEKIFQEASSFDQYFYQPRNGAFPKLSQGPFDYTDKYFVFCQFNRPCKDPEEKEVAPKRLCWTGRSITSDEYLNWASGVVDSWFSGKAASKEFPSDLFDFTKAESLNGFNMSGVEVLFTTWRGFFEFDDLVSGDKLSFSPYNFTGKDGRQKSFASTYSEFFASQPPFEEPNSFTLEFKKDFNTPQELTDALNQKFVQTGRSIARKSPLQRVFSPSTGLYLPSSGILMGEKAPPSSTQINLFRAYNYEQSFSGIVKKNPNSPFNYYSNESGFLISGSRDNNLRSREGWIANNDIQGRIINMPPTVILVSGASETSLNGIYTERGERGGRPFYTRIDKPTDQEVFAISSEDGEDYRIYRGDALPIYQSNGNPAPATPDLVGSWDIIDQEYGSPNPPIVTLQTGSTIKVQSNRRGFFYGRQIFAPGDSDYAGFQFLITGSSPQWVKLGGHIEQVYNEPENFASGASFRVLKNSEQVFPDFGWSPLSDYKGNSFNFDKIGGEFLLSSGDSISIVFDKAQNHESNLIFANPKLQFLSERRKDLKTEISFSKDVGRGMSGFSENWKVYSSGAGNKKYLDGELNAVSNYFARGFYSRGINNLGSFGVTRNDSLVNLNSQPTIGLECYPKFSGNCHVDISVNKSFGFFKSTPSGGSFLPCSNVDVDVFLYSGNTLLKSGRILDPFSEQAVLGGGRYSGFNFSSGLNLNQDSKLELRISRLWSDKFIDYNVDFNVYFNSGSQYLEPQPVWYPYPCPTGAGEEGVFLNLNNSPIAAAELCSGEGCLREFYGPQFDQLDESGKSNILSRHSGRLIKITSNHFNSGGHQMAFIPSDFRKELGQEASYKDRVKYMIPSGATLYGSNTATVWTPLFSNNQFTGELQEESLKNDPLNLFTPNPFAELGEEEEEVENTLVLPSGGFQDLFSLKRFVRLDEENYCPIKANEEVLEVFWPTGWPEIFYKGMSGYPHPCKTSGNEDDEEEDGDEDDKKEEDQEPSGVNPNLTFVRLGDKLDYVNPYFTNGQDLDSVNYRYYRLELSGFYHHPSGLENSVLVSGFHLRNINLFSTKKSLGPILSAEDDCLTNADYTVDVSGKVPVVITGNLTVDIVEGMSGHVKLNNAQLAGRISGLSSGDWVRFVKESGKLTSNSGIGFFSGTIFATGEFSTGVEGFFFNPDSLDENGRPNRVLFEKEYKIFIGEDQSGINSLPSGYLSQFNIIGTGGSGLLTGKYTSLRDSVIARETAAGGFLSPEIFVTVPAESGSGIFFGQITGETVKQNLSGFFETGFIHSGSGSGVIPVSISQTGQTNWIINSLDGFYHTSNASADIIFNNLNNFDSLFINDVQFSYHDNPSLFAAPTFFTGVSQLADSINSQQILTLVSASGMSTSGIRLTSLISGRAGNSISISSSNPTSIEILGGAPNLTGGSTFYPQITGTGQYSYSIADSIPVTGFYFGTQGSGDLIGQINSLLGERNVQSVWPLSSGNQFSTSGMTYYPEQNMYSGNFSGNSGRMLPEIWYFNLGYRNQFSVPTSSGLDVIKISIFDQNNPLVSGENPYETWITGLK